jgi:hypothetical protein
MLRFEEVPYSRRRGEPANYSRFEPVNNTIINFNKYFHWFGFCGEVGRDMFRDRLNSALLGEQQYTMTCKRRLCHLNFNNVPIPTTLPYYNLKKCSDKSYQFQNGFLKIFHEFKNCLEGMFMKLYYGISEWINVYQKVRFKSCRARLLISLPKF